MNKSVFSTLPLTKEILESTKTLQLNSIFVDFQNVSKFDITDINQTLGNNVELYISLTCFEGEDLLNKFPDAKPLEATGKDTLNAVCPTHDGVRQEILERVSTILKLNINGLWLNHIRYPSDWEKAEPNIMDTCYCDRCLKKFSEYIGEEVVGNNLEEKVLLIDGSYYIEWLEFKSLQITSIVKQIRELVNQSGKDIKLGLFAIPWEDKEYGAAIKRVVAQNFSELVPLLDIITPGLYHKMCGKDVSWIKEKLNYFWETGLKQLPIIQSSADISTEEFKQAVSSVISSSAIGVCIFNLEDLLKQPEKIEIIKNIGSVS